MAENEPKTCEVCGQPATRVCNNERRGFRCIDSLCSNPACKAAHDRRDPVMFADWDRHDSWECAVMGLTDLALVVTRDKAARVRWMLEELHRWGPGDKGLPPRRGPE